MTHQSLDDDLNLAGTKFDIIEIKLLATISENESKAFLLNAILDPKKSYLT